MKKISSAVWKFFDRIEENKRCIAVLCRLCGNQYKYFGNTTNLRVHLINKHPMQWELSENGTLDESLNKSAVSTKRKVNKTSKSSDKNVRYSVSLNKDNLPDGIIPKIEIERIDDHQNSDTDAEEETATINLVRQMHGEQQSDEEWLEEDPFQITHIETYEPVSKRKRKYQKIKREIASPTGLPGYYVAPKPEKIIYEDRNRKDEYSVFGEYIANKLRKVPTPQTRGNLQQLITTILWQAEYGMYDDADTVKRVLMLSLQSEPDHIIHFDTSEVMATDVVVEPQTDENVETEQ